MFNSSSVLPSTTVGSEPTPEGVAVQLLKRLMPPGHVVPADLPLVLSHVPPARGVVLLVVIGDKIRAVTLVSDAVHIRRNRTRL